MPAIAIRTLAAAALALAATSASAQDRTVATEAPATVFSDWLQLDASIASGPDAAVRWGFAWTAFFKGASMQLHSSTGQGVGEVVRLSELDGWPVDWDRIDAAFILDEGTLLLIRGAKSLQMHFDEEQGSFVPAGAPADLFPGDAAGVLPAAWSNQVDAAVRWDPNFVMLFRGDEYTLYDLQQEMVSAPAKMADWPGWPAGWERVDAAVNPGYGAVYFFRGSDYVTWDQGANAMVAGAPQSMMPGAQMAPHVAQRLVPRSKESKTSVNMTVGNRTDQPLDLVWVDFQGNETRYATVAPFRNHEQQTFATHVWRAKQGHTIVTQYVASDEPKQKLLVFSHPPGTQFLASYPELKLDPNIFASKNDTILPYPNSDWLGAGFDVTHVDPADLSDVRIGTEGPRRESPIVLTLSDARSADGRYLLPYGVKLRSSATTQDDDVERMIASTEDLRDTLDLGFSQGLDVGIAAFTRALSYSHVNDVKTGSTQIYWLHRAVARHDRISLDLTWEDAAGDWNRQRLAPDFTARVGRFGASCNEGYDQLREAYGTHYAKSVQFGGQYNKLTKINKSSFDRFEGSRTDFEQHLRVSIPDTPVTVSSGQKVGVGSSDSRGQKDEFRDARVFASGGTGFADPNSWKASLRQEPVPVDILFAPMTELLNAAFFPDDPRIYDKQETMRDCFGAYFRKVGVDYKDKATASAAPFFVKEVPEELKKKVPDYRYIVWVGLVDDTAKCEASDRNERAAKGSARYSATDTNFNYGSPFATKLYLCMKKDFKGKPITRIYPISHNAASGRSSCNGNDTRLKENLNDKWNSWGQSDFLCYGTDPSEYPLYDVKVRSVVGGIPDHTHRPSSSGMVLNAGDLLLYLHTQDVKQARDAGLIGSNQLDIVSNIDWNR